MDLMRLREQPGDDVAGALFYLTAGSRTRTAGRLDRETTYVVAGPWTLYLYSDFLFLMSATTWLEDGNQLARSSRWRRSAPQAGALHEDPVAGPRGRRRHGPRGVETVLSGLTL
jgi:hypothetical protein